MSYKLRQLINEVIENDFIGTLRKYLAQDESVKLKQNALNNIGDLIEICADLYFNGASSYDVPILNELYEKYTSKQISALQVYNFIQQKFPKAIDFFNNIKDSKKTILLGPRDACYDLDNTNWDSSLNLVDKGLYKGYIIHLTNNINNIFKNGFEGVDKEHLNRLHRTYKQQLKRVQNGGYVFGYRYKDAKDVNFSYGNSAIVFYGTGLCVYNKIDEDYEVIFNGCQQLDNAMFITKFNRQFHIINYNNGNVVTIKDSLQDAVDWIINNQQYQNKKTKTKYIDAYETLNQLGNLIDTNQKGFKMPNKEIYSYRTNRTNGYDIIIPHKVSRKKLLIALQNNNITFSTNNSHSIFGLYNGYAFNMYINDCILQNTYSGAELEYDEDECGYFYSICSISDNYNKIIEYKTKLNIK